MRIVGPLAVALIAFVAGPVMAAGCGENRDACEAVCTPQRIAQYYAGIGWAEPAGRRRGVFE